MNLPFRSLHDRIVIRHTTQRAEMSRVDEKEAERANFLTEKSNYILTISIQDDYENG